MGVCRLNSLNLHGRIRNYGIRNPYLLPLRVEMAAGIKGNEHWRMNNRTWISGCVTR